MGNILKKTLQFFGDIKLTIFLLFKLFFLVLFIMLSGHYSFIVYHKYNWLILCLIGIISALGRHYFNLRGRNINKPSILFTSIIALLLLAAVIFIFKT